MLFPLLLLSAEEALLHLLQLLLIFSTGPQPTVTDEEEVGVEALVQVAVVVIVWIWKLEAAEA